jgi:uncharacterized protein YjbJ (UPF0337 family)
MSEQSARKEGLEGSVKESTGGAKEEVGEATGNRDLEAEGAAERAEGISKQVDSDVRERVSDGLHKHE